MGFTQEFKEFLDEYKIIGLGIAFVMGAAVTSLVQSLVSDIIMPIITFFVPNGSWQTATLGLGLIVLKWGSFFGALINFAVIALIIFLIAKALLGEKKVTKK